MARPNEPDMPPKRTKNLLGNSAQNLVIFFSSYGNKICQASYRVAREENRTSQQTVQKVMNEKQFYFEFYTASRVTNCGAKYV